MFDKGTFQLFRLKLNNWAGILGSWFPNPTNDGAATEIEPEESETFGFVPCWDWVEDELGLLTAKIKSGTLAFRASKSAFETNCWESCSS